MGGKATLSLAAALAGAACSGACHFADLDGPAGVQRARVLWDAGVPTLGPPALDDSTVYFSTRNHSLIAVRRATGQVKWQAYCCINGDWRSIEPSPVVGGNIVAYGDADLVAFSAAHGVRLWLFDKVDGTYANAGIVPAQTDGVRVYAGSYLGAAFGLDAATGRMLWRADLSPGYGNQVRVHAMRDGLVYVTLRHDGPFYQATVYALEAGSGAIRWQFDMGRSSYASDVILAQPVSSTALLLVTMVEEGGVVALDAASGVQRWHISHPIRPGPADIRMTVSGATLIATVTPTTAESFDQIVGYDLAAGTERWRTQSTQGSARFYYGALTSDAATAFVCFTNGVIGGYDVASGRLQSLQRPPSGQFSGAPVVSHDTLFIAGSEGAYAIAR